MNNKVSNNLIYLASICIPTILIQTYLINDQLLVYLLISFVITIIILVYVFIYGLKKKIKSNILPLPLFIVTFIFFFMIVQYQSDVNNKTSDKLIILIEKYKKDNGNYPHSLTQLEGKYINRTPKIWIGLFPSNYIYYYDMRNNSFSLDQKYGRFGRVWQSSIGSWDYYGD